MKKLLLASAIAALSITAAHAAPTVYGKAYLTLDVKDGNDAAKAASTETRTKLNSNASRIGVKGSEALTANTDVVYQLEYRLEVDTNSKASFTARDTYLGLANKKLGTLVAGRLTAVDDYVNYANVTTGSPVGDDDVLASVSGPRANNAFAYFSPEYNGVQLMGMYVLDETNQGATSAEESFGRDAWGVAAKYEPSSMPLKAGVSYLQAGKNTGKYTNHAAFDNAIRVSAAYAFNPAITAAAQYQITDLKQTANSKKENALTVSGSYKVAQTPWTAYGQLDFVDNYEGVKDAERQRLVLGGKYGFNQNTTGHIYSGYLKEKSTGAKDQNSYGIGAGLEYKF
jgi:outer membrane porin M35